MDRLTIVMQRPDRRPLGTFREVRKVLRTLFRNIRFAWSSDGLEMLQLLIDKGFEVPDVIRREHEKTKSTLEGGFTRVGQLWEISLGLEEPVFRIYVNVVSVDGSVPEERDQLIKALESAFGAVSAPTDSWPGRP